MELKPHGLNIDLKVELLGKKKPINKQRSSFEAIVEVDNGQNKGKLTFPMRSFNKYLLEWLWQMFSGDITTNPYLGTATKAAGIDTKLKSVNCLATAGTLAGLVIGTTDSNYLDANTIALQGVLEHSDDATAGTVNYGITSWDTAGTGLANGEYGFCIKRKISNQTSSTLFPIVTGIKTRNANAGASKAYIAFEEINEGNVVSFAPLSDLNLTFVFYVQPSTYQVTKTGGITRILYDIIKDLIFRGQSATTPENYINNSPTSYTYTSSLDATSSTQNMLKIIPSTPTTAKGILLFVNENDKYSREGEFPSNINILPTTVTLGTGTSVVSGLTLGTNVMSKIEVTNSTITSFTVYRDFANNTNNLIKCTRVGLVSGASDLATHLLAYNLVFSEDSNSQNASIVVPAGDTLRVSYTFSTEM